MEIKQKSKPVSIVPDERIMNKIYYIRGKKVMFDRDLAELYGVAPKVLNQAVKRNAKRFPDDFMFKLSKEEMLNLKSQIVTSSWGGAKNFLMFSLNRAWRCFPACSRVNEQSRSIFR